MLLHVWTYDFLIGLFNIYIGSDLFWCTCSYAIFCVASNRDCVACRSAVAKRQIHLGLLSSLGRQISKSKMVSIFCQGWLPLSRKMISTVYDDKENCQCTVSILHNRTDVTKHNVLTLFNSVNCIRFTLIGHRVRLHKVYFYRTPQNAATDISTHYIVNPVVLSTCNEINVFEFRTCMVRSECVPIFRVITMRNRWLWNIDKAKLPYEFEKVLKYNIYVHIVLNSVEHTLTLTVSSI